MVVESRIPEDRSDAVRVEDLVPIRSRVSWPAIFAGSIMALAIFFVLMLLGAAVGLTVYDDVNRGQLNTGAAVWAIVSTLLALFAGGWVVSQATVGENKCEATIHGVLMWGTTFALLLGMAGLGVRAGFGAMVGVATISERIEPDRATAQNRLNMPEVEKALRDANLNDQQIATVRATLENPVAKAREVINQPENRERVATASWWTLFGVLLSMATAIAGALVGAGPTFRLFQVGAAGRVAVTTRRETVRT